ncbi:MAG TPA: autotransporter-associated beta strand repeat-containing protein [Verrucomicrobiae bacterium]|jgi:autotransporter-associated beta strand protein|nr:autotransporter-associated beta strand repeat-containing protein [Verrucomicrobiae bacterium]
MRQNNISRITLFCGLVLAANLTPVRAQNATWTGPASGGEWNTVANWDIGVPAEGTNALIGNGTNVSYNLPMTATTFGALTENGILNINAAGFNCTGIALATTNGADKLFINNGAAVTVNGNVTMSTNASVTMTAGSSLTINGALDVSYNTSSKASGLATFTNSGGAFSAFSTAVNQNGGTENALMVINGGTNNLGTTVVGRSNAGSGGFNALGSEGLIIYNGIVITTNLNIGNNGAGNSFLTTLIAGGIVTNFGTVFINQGSGNRASRLLQTGGLFVMPDPGVVNPNSSVANAIALYSVLGGTNIVGGFNFGATNATVIAMARLTNSAVIYVGSQGIVSNGAMTLNVSLNNGGMFGATAPWISDVPMILAGGTFTFKTADLNGNPNNIVLSNTLSGPGALYETGGGTLTLDATNTYTGNTVISAGTLAMGGSGALINSGIYVGQGTTYDVSQAVGYALNAHQTLAGFGLVNGAVNVASTGIISPGSNIVTGTLTINGGLTESGGAVNNFQLSGNPSGPGNDLLSLPGGFTVSGANSIFISGSVQVGGIYPLISYSGGTFSGDVSDFTVSGASGVLSNSVSSQTIYYIAQESIRAATNITWDGTVANNNWDTQTSSNWLNNGTGLLDIFVPGDNVLFSNLGTNVVNIPGSVQPGSVTINNSYTFTGNGAIGGLAGLTVSNGTSIMLTTNNSYTGPTILDGGILVAPFLANGTALSSIGAASSASANFIFNGGTLSFTGPSLSTDRGLTLTNGGGTINVTNGSTLTLNGSIVGNGVLTVNGSGTLILNNGNSYTNTTAILASTLQLNNGNGAGSGTISFSNSSLIYNPSSGITVPNALNFVPGTTNTIVVTSGSGGNPISGGNWIGGGVVLVSNTFNPFTANGILDGFTGIIMLDTPNGAEFRFNSGGGNSCFGSTNATFDLAVANASLVCRNPGIMNLGALEGVPQTLVFGPTATPGTVTWSVGWNNLSSTYSGTIANNSANEFSALTKVGTGTLTLDGGSTVSTNEVTDPNTGFSETVTGYVATITYTEATILSNGVLALVAPDTLTNSASVTLAAPNVVLDATAMGFISNLSFTLPDGSSEVLITNSVFEISTNSLNGVGTLNGNLQADQTSTFNVGLPTGVFNVTGNASLSGAINMNLSGALCSKVAAQSFTIGNTSTLNVTNIGGGLANGTTFTLFNQAVSGFGTVNLPLTDPTGTTNYVWANNLGNNGTITLTTGGVVVAPNPPHITFGFNGNTLSLSWPQSYLGYSLQAQTNSLSVGLSTNWVTVPGSSSVTSVNITIVPGNPTVFFRLTQ